MDNLQQGIDALKSGNKDAARRFLALAVNENPNDEFTWQWMFNASNTDKERFTCLQNIIRINPGNQKAAKLFQELSGLNDQVPITPGVVQKTPAPNQKNTLVGLGAVSLICIICLCIFSMTLNNGNKTKDYKTMAYLQCQIHVEDRLKAPSTADYPPSSTINILDSGNNIYEMNSFVDAQNSFGAKIRTNFYCKIQFIGDAKSDEALTKNWKVIQLTISE